MKIIKMQDGSHLSATIVTLLIFSTVVTLEIGE